MLRYCSFMLVAMGLVQAQETTLTTSSSFSQATHTATVERRVDAYRTRLVGFILPGNQGVAEVTLDLPPEAPEVAAAVAKMKAELAARADVQAVQGPVRKSQSTSTESQVTTVRDRVVRTIGVTTRETIGPATINIGALNTEANPCASYTGGTPIGTGGLTEGDGFQFHFTSPVRCGTFGGTRFTVASGTKNIDTLTHIQSDVYATATTTRTVTNISTFELFGTLAGSPVTPVPGEPSAREDIGLLVRYVSNLDRGDAIIHLTNSGARGADLRAGMTASTTGAICVNVYAFTGDDQFVGCCSCPVTPNGLMGLSARNDLTANSLLPTLPTSIIVKLYPTTPEKGSCSGSAASPGQNSPGLHAWSTTILTGPNALTDISEGVFLHTSSTVGERESLAARCTTFYAGGSGFGICRSCRVGSGSAGRVSIAP